jgi:hypothetical protein
VARPRATPRLRGKLPKGWRKKLSRDQVQAVLNVEAAADLGSYRIQPTKHEKGYVRITLPVFHPYALAGRGTQLLHRYLVMRQLGRVLGRHEHVHHGQDGAKDTTDLRQLEIQEELHHGHYHYGKRIACGHHHPLWKPRDARGRFTKLPTPAALAAAAEELSVAMDVFDQIDQAILASGKDATIVAIGPLAQQRMQHNAATFYAIKSYAEIHVPDAAPPGTLGRWRGTWVVLDKTLGDRVEVR